MSQIGHNCCVLAFQIAPVLTTVLPNLFVSVGFSFVSVTYGDVVTVIVDFHERAALTLFILRIVWVIAYVDLVVLEVLFFILVLVWRQTVVQVLNQHDAVLKPRHLEIELNFQFVVHNLIVCCLVAGSMKSRCPYIITTV